MCLNKLIIPKKEGFKRNNNGEGFVAKVGVCAKVVFFSHSSKDRHIISCCLTVVCSTPSRYNTNVRVKSMVGSWETSWSYIPYNRITALFVFNCGRNP